MLKRRTPLKRYTPLKQVSKNQAKRLNRYRPVKKEFLSEHPDCAVCGRPAVQVHHGKGKIGDLLYETEFFVPLCDGECHLYLECNPSIAIKLGLSIRKLQ